MTIGYCYRRRCGLCLCLLCIHVASLRVDPTEMLPTSPTLLILVAVIAVLFTSMVISVVVMTVKIRKQLRKQQSPIYISESNISTVPSLNTLKSFIVCLRVFDE